MRHAMFLVVMLVAGQIQAGTITQDSGFGTLGRAVVASPINQFNPALGTLNDVVVSMTLNASDPTAVIDNNTSTPITTNVTTLISASYGNSEIFSQIGPTQVTLGAFADYELGVLVPGALTLSGILFAALEGDGVYGEFVGTSTTDVVPLFSETVTVSSPDLYYEYGIYLPVSGTETVTYYYGNSFYVPAPSSAIILGMGLFAVMIVRRCG